MKKIIMLMLIISLFSFSVNAYTLTENFGNYFFNSIDECQSLISDSYQYSVSYDAITDKNNIVSGLNNKWYCMQNSYSDNFFLADAVNYNSYPALSINDGITNSINEITQLVYSFDEPVSISNETGFSFYCSNWDYMNITTGDPLNTDVYLMYIMEKNQSLSNLYISGYTISLNSYYNSGTGHQTYPQATSLYNACPFLMLKFGEICKSETPVFVNFTFEDIYKTCTQFINGQQVRIGAGYWWQKYHDSNVDLDSIYTIGLTHINYNNTDNSNRFNFDDFTIYNYEKNNLPDGNIIYTKNLPANETTLGFNLNFTDVEGNTIYYSLYSKDEITYYNYSHKLYYYNENGIPIDDINQFAAYGFFTNCDIPESNVKNFLWATFQHYGANRAFVDKTKGYFYCDDGDYNELNFLTERLNGYVNLTLSMADTDVSGLYPHNTKFLLEFREDTNNYNFWHIETNQSNIFLEDLFNNRLGNISRINPPTYIPSSFYVSLDGNIQENLSICIYDVPENKFCYDFESNIDELRYISIDNYNVDNIQAHKLIYNSFDVSGNRLFKEYDWQTSINNYIEIGNTDKSEICLNLFVTDSEHKDLNIYNEYEFCYNLIDSEVKPDTEELTFNENDILDSLPEDAGIFQQILYIIRTPYRIIYSLGLLDNFLSVSWIFLILGVLFLTFENYKITQTLNIHFSFQILSISAIIFYLMGFLTLSMTFLLSIIGIMFFAISIYRYISGEEQ